MKRFGIFVLAVAAILLCGCNEKPRKSDGGGEASVVDTVAREKFVDFSATYRGKTQRLSDYVGRGELVVADFWASWCGPCRREIPTLKRIYERFKGKVVVLGIATWDDPADTERAIAELGITYPQMLNAQTAGSDAYGIEGIPEIIVFAPDGTILSRGLRGDELERYVEACVESHSR